MDRVIALVDDLMFLSRIREAARRQGLEVAAVRSVPDLLAACAEPPRLVVVDLDRARPPAAGEALAALRAEPALANVPVVGFFSHVHAERGRQAREDGYTAMPRSVFVETLDATLASPPARVTP
jgi:ActR/RegA family two-component response regulator